MKVASVRYLLFILLSLLLTLSGCSTPQTSKAVTVTKSTPSQPFIGKSVSHPDPKENGELINLVKINIAQAYDLQSYKMTYWSGGVETVAYVAIPTGQGTYPLFLNLHGGYVIGFNEGNVRTIVNFSQIISLNSTLIENAAKKTITIAPMYRGYGESEGYVHGIDGNARDTENAIKALKSYFENHPNGPQIETNHTYIMGESMGGGVALKVAAERTDVVYTIAISPFVGWDITGAWDQQHNKKDFKVMTENLGPFDPNALTYKSQSVDYKKIKSPVLLVQGTADPNVQWQTVQMLYKDMNANHQNVTFKLIKGGNHGLTNKQNALNQAINNFVETYWEF